MNACEPVSPSPAGESPTALTGAIEDERELAHLGQRQRRCRGDRSAVPEREHAAGGGQRLDDDHERHRCENERQVADQEADIEQHADRHEERGAEEDLQRHDLAEGVVAEAALADDEAGQEGAERQADAGNAGQPGGAEADRDDRQEKELRRTGQRHALEQRRHQPARDHEHRDDEPQRLRRAPRQSARPIRRSPPSIGTTRTMTMTARS